MRRYKGRYFKVCIKKLAEGDTQQLVIDLFRDLGYKLELSEDNEWTFKKGSMIFTYAGLINWELIFRRVIVSWLPASEEICLTYIFPWATNIGLLSGAAKPELIKIMKTLGSDKIKFIRKR